MLGKGLKDSIQKPRARGGANLPTPEPHTWTDSILEDFTPISFQQHCTLLWANLYDFLF